MSSPGVSSKPISLLDVITHYEVIGLAIGVAIGIAVKEWIFSLSNDIIMPGLGVMWKNNRFLQRYTFKPDSFFSHMITLIIVLGVILLLLIYVLKPLVAVDIHTAKEKSFEEKKNREIVEQYQQQMVTYLKTIQTIQEKNIEYSRLTGSYW